MLVAVAEATIDRAQVPDLPDRIIATTAVHLDAPPISRDQIIRSICLLLIRFGKGRSLKGIDIQEHGFGFTGAIALAVDILKGAQDLVPLQNNH